MQNPTEFAAYFAYSSSWRAVRFMPERMAYRTFSTFADQIWRQQGKGVKQLEKNLQRVVPDARYAQLRELSRASMQSYFRYWCDVFRLPDWSQERIISTSLVENEAQFANSLSGGRGLVITIPHSGNWDHLGAYGTLVHAPVASVAEDLKPERLTEKFLVFRRDIGMKILTLRPGADIFSQLIDLVHTGHIVALLGDRDLTAHGVPVDFFGEATRMPAGPAALARATGVDLLTADLWYTTTGIVTRIHDPIPIDPELSHDESVRVTTQVIADRFAAGIAEHPADWHMMQRLWLADLDGNRLKTSRYDADRDPGSA